MIKNQLDERDLDTIFPPQTENEKKINEIYEQIEFESRMSCYEEENEE